MKQARGYIKSGEFRGQRVPQHIQNRIVRQYCHERGLGYVLARSEYSFKDCSCHLEAAFNDQYPVIVAYSMLILPEEPKRRRELYKKLIKSGKEIHFACEDMKIKRNDFENSLKTIELMICCYDATRNSRIRAK